MGSRLPARINIGQGIVGVTRIADGHPLVEIAQLKSNLAGKSDSQGLAETGYGLCRENSRILFRCLLDFLARFFDAGADLVDGIVDTPASAFRGAARTATADDGQCQERQYEDGFHVSRIQSPSAGFQLSTALGATSAVLERSAMPSHAFRMPSCLDGSGQNTPAVSFHSIIGHVRAGPTHSGSDGVCAYSSSHLDGAESKLIVSLWP